ncbi:MAG: alpha-1,2-fucosyltransferase [Clostridia bacterium]|nr:alpha-1,2-fucosyltransferase [Clostridia bacterium]
MFIFRLRNGLGNQMFIMTFAERLKTLYPNHAIIYDNSDIPSVLNGRNMRPFTEFFNHDFPIATNKEIRAYCGKPLYNIFQFKKYNCNFLYKINQMINSFEVHQTNVKKINEPEYWNVSEDFVADICSKKIPDDNNIIYYFNGFWENMKYIYDIIPSLNNIFSFKISNKKILNLAAKISDEESVAVHIRRGDYLKESKLIKYPKNYYCVCNQKYYERAIEMIYKKLTNPVFYFFSDDITYAKKQYAHIKNCIFIDDNKDYEDLFLMTKCNNIIVANSTFSFWGAMLGNKANVIAPKLHYIHFENPDTYKKVNYFLYDKWNYIDNDIVV